MPTPFELMYRKQKHPRLFESLEAAQTGICNLQNYIPIYQRFFALSDTNHNHINLNHRHHVASVAAGANKHVVSVTLESTDSESPLVKTEAFIKYSPLLDPIKHLSGKYDMAATDLLTLPKYESGNTDSVHQKKCTTRTIRHMLIHSSHISPVRRCTLTDLCTGLIFMGHF